MSHLPPRALCVSGWGLGARRVAVKHRVSIGGVGAMAGCGTPSQRAWLQAHTGNGDTCEDAGFPKAELRSVMGFPRGSLGSDGVPSSDGVSSWVTRRGRGRSARGPTCS